MAKSSTKAAADHMNTNTPIRIIDLTKSDDNATARCLVEYKETGTNKWITVDEIRRSYPRLLIDYYESRITVVPKK